MVMNGLSNPHVNEAKTPRADAILLLYSKYKIC